MPTNGPIFATTFFVLQNFGPIQKQLSDFAAFYYNWCLFPMAYKVLIIVPCYNEEFSLPLVLTGIQATPFKEGFAVTPLVINDCSKDKTRQAAESFKVNVLNLPMNLGIGGAVQTGFKYALRNNFDLAIQLDGDGQHPPTQVNKLLEAWQQTGANIVIGSRFIDGEGFQSSILRRIGINYFYWLNRIFAGVSVYDSTSGFRLLDKAAIVCAAHSYPDDYPEPESLIMFGKAGLKIKEVPVMMSHRLGGKSSISHGRSFYYVIKVTIAMFFTFIRKN
jgi:glycosyltransferase involved in cell wall biosynthesis